MPIASPTANPAQTSQVKSFLQMIRSFLSDFYRDGVQRLIDVRIAEDGNVSGIFQGRGRDLFLFSLENDLVRYKLYEFPAKLDSQQVSYLCQVLDLPLPLSGDAYSSGFLSAWLRQDAKKKNQCEVGTSCGQTCIARSDECRIRLSTPVARRKAKAVKDAAKLIDKLGASPLIAPILAIAAAGSVGLAAGLAIGGFVGASAAARPSPPPPPRPEKPPRKSRFKPEDIPDPWDETAVTSASTSKKKTTRAKIPLSPPATTEPEQTAQQLEIDQGIRYVTSEAESRTIVPEQVGGVVAMSPNDLRLAPKLFQYKLPNEISAAAARRYQEQGTTGALSDVEAWNPQVAGTLQVWRVPKDFASQGENFKEGEVLLVHGHHRLSLAKRAEAVVVDPVTGETQPGKVESVQVEFINAATVREAKVIGAMQNIAQGAGTPRDAASIFRELKIDDPQQLKNRGISLKGAIAEQGLGLAGLNDRLWRKVSDLSNTEMTVRRASYIGQIRNPDLQDEVWKQVRDRSGATDEYVRSLSQTVQHQLEVGQVSVESNESGDQGMLFDVQKTVAGVADRAEVDAFIEMQIGREEAFWKRAARPARMQEILAREGAGEIDINRAGEVSDEVAAARYTYRKGKFVNNDPNYLQINNSLNTLGNELRAMRQRGSTPREIDEFKQNAWQQIRDLLAGAI